MPKKRTDIDTDDLCKRYFAYERFSQIAKEFGVSTNTIIRRIKEMGLPTGKIGERIPREELIFSYVNGTSERELARRYNTERIVIKSILIEAGVSRRTNTEANRMMASGRTRQENIKNTSAAHMAVRGKPQSEEHRRKIALGIERKGLIKSFGEKILAQKLIEKGLVITPQKAIGRYNIDIALTEFPIAVEIFGGCWHSYGTHSLRFRKRIDYLINSGWLPIIIWGKNSTRDDFSGAAEYIFSLVQRLRGGEALVCQEHVISGSGDPCAVGKSNLEYRAAIGGDKCSDIVRGKDGRFTYDTVGVSR